MGLIEFWKKLDIKKKTFVHPEDEDYIENLEENYTTINCYDDYINNNSTFRADEHKFHFNLIPIPYIGDIKKAKIYILMLNPGFEILDYYAESKDNELKYSLINNLRQENFDPKYPFIFLNPKFLWHGGGRYYENRFKELIEKAKGDTYDKQLSQVAKKVAVLQLVPYHSKNYKQSEKPLPKSSNRIQNFVMNELLPKAGKEIEIIFVRGDKWGDLKTNVNVIKSDKKQRSSHISKKIFENHWDTIIAKLNES